MALLSIIIFPPFLAAILNICEKHKKAFISETVRDGATKLLGPWLYAVSSGTFAKNHFPTIFGSHLEFLYKLQKHIYLQNSPRKSYFNEIFGLQGIHRVIWHFLPKIVFLTFLAAILNFCLKPKKRIYL